MTSVGWEEHRAVPYAPPELTRRGRAHRVVYRAPQGRSRRGWEQSLRTEQVAPCAALGRIPILGHSGAGYGREEHRAVPYAPQGLTRRGLAHRSVLCALQGRSRRVWEYRWRGAPCAVMGLHLRKGVHNVPSAPGSHLLSKIACASVVQMKATLKKGM